MIDIPKSLMYWKYSGRSSLWQPMINLFQHLIAGVSQPRVTLHHLVTSVNESIIGGILWGARCLAYNTAWPWRSRLASLHAGSLPIPSDSQQEASTCRSQEFCGRPLGLLQVNPGCPLWKQPDKQDWLPGIAPHAHIAAVCTDGLCL